uniref:EF-hand domain-containing protein n=1 Tax=Oryza punctata TaxID=4537 RepID=A0A0E0LNF5_ORYPU
MGKADKKQQQQQQHGGDEAAAAERAKEKLEHFKKWLVQFDVDGDGKINWRELRDAIRRRGARFASLKAWFNLHRADKNRNGVIDDDEIKHLMDLAEKDLDFKMPPSTPAARPAGAPAVVVSTCQFETTPPDVHIIELHKLTAKPQVLSTTNNN